MPAERGKPESSDRTLRRSRVDRRKARSDTFFVGRRPFEAPEVYVVSATGVDRLRSSERFGTRELDWFAPGRAAMELAHALLTWVVTALPSQRLTYLLAVDVISQLDDDGFVLSSAQILAWVQHFSQPEDWTAAHTPNQGSWTARSWWGSSPPGALKMHSPPGASELPEPERAAPSSISDPPGATSGPAA